MSTLYDHRKNVDDQHFPTVGETFTLKNVLQIIDQHRLAYQGEIDKSYKLYQNKLLDELNKKGIVKELYKEFDGLNSVEFKQKIVNRLIEEDSGKVKRGCLKEIRNQDLEQVIKELEYQDPGQVKKECLNYLKNKDPEKVKKERLEKLGDSGLYTLKLGRLRMINPEKLKNEFLEEIKNQDPKGVKKAYLNHLKDQDLKQIRRQRYKYLEDQNPEEVKNKLIQRLNSMNPEEVRDEFLERLNRIKNFEDLIDNSFQKYINAGKEVLNLTKQDFKRLMLGKLLEFLEKTILEDVEGEEQRFQTELINGISPRLTTLNLHKAIQKCVSTNNHKFSLQLLQKSKNLENFHYLLMVNSNDKINKVKYGEIVETYLILLSFFNEQIKPFNNLFKGCLNKVGKILTEEDVEYLKRFNLKNMLS